MPINSYDNYHLSWKPEKSHLKQPYYLSLASALAADISAGKLKPGTMQCNCCKNYPESRTKTVSDRFIRL